MNQPLFEFSPELLRMADAAEQSAAAAFARVDAVERHNGMKVLKAFVDHKISAAHLSGSTGYGYGDLGRDALDAVFAQTMGAEDALVRHTFVSGTHALAVALFGLLRPGDLLLSVTGKPYDTLEEVIGLRGGQNNQGSLADFGVGYEQIELLPDGTIDFESAQKAAPRAAVVYLQRSRGYSVRPSLFSEDFAPICAKLKAANPNLVILTDNCYGEFVEKTEPVSHGVDLMAGSLIKNPGGGIARTGGYIAGRRDLVERCSYRMTTPGMGREVGCSLDELRSLYMGLFFAPTTVAAALKTAIFASALFAQMGYCCSPTVDEERADIIQSLCLKEREAVIRFCGGIQSGSPIDSRAAPEPWDMPGYKDQVIMAAGAFTLGASIELSADAPMREPYSVWMQGGLTYPTGRAGVLLAAQRLLSHD